MKIDTPIRIKIREADYSSYLGKGAPKKYLRFYELEYNGNVVYRKRGMK